MNVNSADPADVLRFAVLHAVASITNVKIGSNLEEEFITGGLFGAISSAFPLSAALYGLQPNHPTTLFWGQFKKSVPAAVASARDCESLSGADFALVLCVGEDDYRLAIFQAKRVKGKRITIHHRARSQNAAVSTAPKALRDSQLVSLWNKGISVRQSVASNAGAQARRFWSENDLSWVHYLAYGATNMQCLPLSEFGAQFNSERIGGRAGPVLVQSRHISFEELISNGFYPNPARGNVFMGWLCLSWSQAKRVLPQLISTTDLYFVDRQTAQGVLSLVIGRRPQTVFDPAYTSIVQEIKAAKLINFRPPEPQPPRQRPDSKKRNTI